MGIARSFQVPQLFNSLAVRDNLLAAVGIVAAAAKRWAHDAITRERAAAVTDEMLERFGLGAYRDKPAGVLPEGVRKLLDIAMAMVVKPKILLLDEPTSGVSADEKFGIMDVVMSAVKADRVTVLFVEHDMDIVSRYAERVLAFYDGRIIADGARRRCAAVIGGACPFGDATGEEPAATMRVDSGRKHYMLRIDSLDVAIESVGILRGVNLAVGRGRFAGLIGRNGAGKTTLMRSIMGILRWRAGGIAFDGQPLAGVPTHARAQLGIGYMPEDRRLIPALTVEENVLLPAWSTHAPDAAATLQRVYAMIPEVGNFAQRKALQFSGGQQKLVALARALMCGDKLLLLDEPFEGVAPVLARRLAEVIAGLKRAGLTVILSESSVTHARELLDDIFVIDRGVVARSPA